MLALRKPIVVVGSINTDLVVNAPRIPAPGETLTGSTFATFQGGKGANQAVAIARLGYPVALIGMVGSDAFGKASLRHLEAEGVHTEAIATEPGPSGVALITVAAQGENSIVVVPGANAALTPEFLEQHRSLIANAAMVLAQLEIPIDAIAHLAVICREERVPLMLDPAPAIALPRGLLAQCTWVTPNETEAAFYTQNAADPATALLALGIKRLILKRGSQGATLASGSGQRTPIPAFAVEAVDSTAAGDCFNAAFAVSLVTGKSAEESARFASAAAALSVTRAGAQASMPTLAQVRDFFAAHSAT